VLEINSKSISFGYEKHKIACILHDDEGTKPNRLAHQIELRVTVILNFLAMQVDAGLNFNPRACLIVSLLRLIDWWCLLRCAR
jgi:hypothetical protein